MMRVINVKGPYYFCRSVYQFNLLLEKGVIPFNTVPDDKNPGHRLWIYKTSEELAKALNAIASEGVVYKFQ